MELLRTGATKVRITLMYYVDFYSLFNKPEKEWDIILSKAFDAPSEPVSYTHLTLPTICSV